MEAQGAMEAHLLLQEDVLLALRQRGSVFQVSLPGEDAFPAAQASEIFSRRKLIPTNT